ncbi:MAG: pyridoxamine kinase [Treponema sp.]|nr:pyridoxamine kinase [Spirochaetia bacterium]MDY2840443.1 pyridoxamine kinase [Treponema sp.]MDY5124378.1 pyridoxamine kinase [Treponema sp.]
MKRVLTVQDISCVGKCSLTVALPVISAMGVETCVLPTAVLSNHTAFSGFTFRDLTEDIQPVCEQWKKEKLHFDAIYTGYLGSFEQLNLIGKLIEDFGGKDTITIVDPCMADNGKLYTGFTKEFAAAMGKLCSKADVIVPNLTEASYLLDIPYIESGYNEDYIHEILVKLSRTGAKKIVLKGVQYGKGEKLGIVSYDSETETFSQYFHKKMPQSFHGTGDIFASVLTGALMRNVPFEKAYALAADFVVQAISETLAHADYNWYGVDFESAIPYLVGRLNN